MRLDARGEGLEDTKTGHVERSGDIRFIKKDGG
jgi:hypothetical protein